MSTETVEHVLVVPTLLFHEIGYFQGFTDQIDRYMTSLLDPAHTKYFPRPEMEEDPSYKQLIPYCIFKYQDQLFHYERGKAQGEKRLHAKRSVGVGGHISTVDIQESQSVYDRGMQRELEEEVEIQSSYEQHCIGLINDDETDVGRVHLGVVHLFELEEAKVFPRESSMIETGFSPISSLLSEVDQFETWSQICLKSIFS